MSSCVPQWRTRDGPHANAAARRTRDRSSASAPQACCRSLSVLSLGCATNGRSGTLLRHACLSQSGAHAERRLPMEGALSPMAGQDYVDAERRDAEVVADRAERTTTVADLVDLREVRNGVFSHCHAVSRLEGDRGFYCRAYSSADRDSNSNPTKRSSPRTHASCPGSIT